MSRLKNRMPVVSEELPADVWTIGDVARYLKLSRTTIYKLMEEGLPSFRLGGSRRFDPRDVARFWNERRASSA